MNDATTAPTTFKPRSTFPIKIGWPAIFPENETVPFSFVMRIQMLLEADELQEQFMALPERDQEARRHAHDAARLAQLCTELPGGFPDLVVLENETFQEAINRYFGVDASKTQEADDKNATMKMIVRGVMSRYWRALLPKDYL